MDLSKVCESGTTSEEEDVHSNKVLAAPKIKNASEESDTASEEDPSPVNRITSHEKIAPAIKPGKPRIKSRIGGRKRSHEQAKDESPTPPPPNSPPPKRVKPTSSPPPSEGKAGQSIIKECVFQHSGKPKYFLEDGPVSLFPIQNEYAQGGFCVWIQQKGEFVGLISAGQEVACRKLLDKGAKAELRYLGEGKSEVVMRYTSTD